MPRTKGLIFVVVAVLLLFMALYSGWRFYNGRLGTGATTAETTTAPVQPNDTVNVDGRTLKLRPDEALVVDIGAAQAQPQSAVQVATAVATAIVIQPNPTAAVATFAPPATWTPVPVQQEPTWTPVPPVIPVATAVPVAPVSGHYANDHDLVNYTVQPGDTLYSIAEKHGTTVALMAEHGIDSDDIAHGAVIAVARPNPNFCNDKRTYVVDVDDTLFSISRRFNTDVVTLQRINNLGDSNLIREAQVLCIPY